MRPIAKLLVAGALMAGGILADATASAQSRREFDVQFRVDPAYAPTWICTQVGAQFVPGGELIPSLQRVTGAGPTYEPPLANVFAPPSPHSDQASQSAQTTMEAKSLVDPALTSLAKSHETFRQKALGGAPLWSAGIRFAPPKDARRVACKQVVGDTAGPDRVAVIELRTKSGRGAFLGARVAGRMLRFQMEDVESTDEVVVQSLGGSYDVTSIPTSNGEAVLELHPRWEMREVRVAGATQRCVLVREDALERHYEDRLSLRNGSFSLPIPRGTGTLSVDVSTFDPDVGKDCSGSTYAQEHSGLQLVGTFDENDPVFTPRVKTFRFSTLRSCEPSAYMSCPNAWVSTNSTPCGDPLKTGDGRCEYTCELGTAGQMPLDVRLTLGPSNAPAASWLEHVVSADQALCAAPTDFGRKIVLDGWPDPKEIARADNHGDGISYIDVLGASGELYRLRPSQMPMPLLHIPSASSGAKLRYSLVGDRVYSEDVASVKDGQLHIRSPQDLAHHVEGIFELEGGYGGGAGSLFGPYGTILFGIRYLPSAATWYFEGRLSADVSGQQFVPFTGETESEPRFVAFVRFMNEGAMFWRVQRFLSLGASLGLGLGYPYSTSDQERVGGVRLNVPIGGVLLRVPLSPNIAIGLQARIFPDPLYSFKQSIDDVTHAFRGNPVKTSTESVFLMFGGGLTIRL
jgi:hypothetical protein